MADPMTGPNTRCPWCSAALPDPGAEQCPGCGANLVTSPEVAGEIRGVTTLDPEAILRARSELVRPRPNRLIAFLTGEAPVEVDATGEATSLAPPELAVRREMLRLQLEAEAADLQAETVALKADELARRGVHLADLGPIDEAAPPDAGTPAAPDGGPWPAEVTPVEEPRDQG